MTRPPPASTRSTATAEPTRCWPATPAAVNGGPGADQIVGGRSTSATTVIHGGADNDTIVSGLGDDDVFGDAGSNTLAYASVLQGGP